MTKTEIIDAVSKRFSVSIDDIKGRSRLERIVRTRTVVALMMRDICQFSFPHIARELGMKSHTTILKNIENIRRRMEEDTRLASAVSDVKVRLGEPEPPYRGFGKGDPSMEDVA